MFHGIPRCSSVVACDLPAEKFDGVATWIFSPLKFQADMGILLTFMFVVNMLGAIVLLPALAHWLRPKA